MLTFSYSIWYPDNLDCSWKISSMEGLQFRNFVWKHKDMSTIWKILETDNIYESYTNILHLVLFIFIISIWGTCMCSSYWSVTLYLMLIAEIVLKELWGALNLMKVSSPVGRWSCPFWIWGWCSQQSKNHMIYIQLQLQLQASLSLFI